MATQSNILARIIPWAEEGTVHGVAESDTTEPLSMRAHTQYSTYQQTFQSWSNFKSVVSYRTKQGSP